MDVGEVAHSVCDLDGRFLEVDAALSDLLHLSFDEIFARDILDVTFAEDRRHNGDLIHDLVEHGRAFTMRKRYVRVDGSLVWARTHVSRLIGARGQSRLNACIRPLPVDESEIATKLAEAARRANRIERQLEMVRKSLPAHAARGTSTVDDR